MSSYMYRWEIYPACQTSIKPPMVGFLIYCKEILQSNTILMRYLQLLFSDHGFLTSPFRQTMARLNT